MQAHRPDAEETGFLMRSLLFVPADQPRKIPKAFAAGADAVILDLEDSVAPDAKVAARAAAREVLSGDRPCKTYVRVNALGTGLTLSDVEAALPLKPDGLVLPKSESADSVNQLASLCMLVGPGEAVPPIIAIATETAASLFHMASYSNAHPALQALNWGMEDLAASLGAKTNRDDMGEPTAPYQLARTLCLIGARAAGAKPIDAVYANFRDHDGLAKQCREAARDGFTAKMCIHPDQIGPVNAAFMPSSEEIARAQAIVSAFQKAGNPGVLSWNGEMLDAPHLKAAQALLRRAAL
jgi:citrate lyase subunit beta/citryl-CoA lyase